MRATCLSVACSSMRTIVGATIVSFVGGGREEEEQKVYKKSSVTNLEFSELLKSSAVFS